MDDPWDVKSVRQSGQYISCMKINGVPLLPPVLSKECRKEMQYYKILAKEVEKRISILQPYVVSSDSESNEDKMSVPEIPECEPKYEEVPAGFNFEEISIKQKAYDETLTNTIKQVSNDYTLSCDPNEDTDATSKFLVDFSLSIDDTGRNINRKPTCSSPVEIPERDYNCTKTKKLLTDIECNNDDKIIENIANFSFTVIKEHLSNPSHDTYHSDEEPKSLSAKSFTGSLNNIFTESLKESQIIPKLLRQRSYTLLNPSPQLLAHLEVQSLNTGVEMSRISMSDSLSNVSSAVKKRRSWDLESAKAKWSKMALELKQKNMSSVTNRNQATRTTARRGLGSPPRARSVVPERTRRASLNSKPTPKADPVQKARRPSPLRNIPSNKTITKGTISPNHFKDPTSKLAKGPTPKPVKDPPSPKSLNHKKEPLSPKSASSKIPKPQLISESDDPATKVRELYEKIQKQQLVQMAGLVEKQKREQMLLQQVFEEQNNMLFKQLKTICPKSPVEVKEAWGDKSQEGDRGPVSLSQLINHKSPEQSIRDSPVNAITDSHNYINRCDNVLKKSRDISGSLKKQAKSQSQNGSKIHAPKTQPDGSLTRTHSPSNRSALISRKLNYDTSTSDRDYEPMILTDRTNDTMADLNVTFPSDSDDCRPYSHNSTLMNLCGKDVTVIHSGPFSSNTTSTDSAIMCMEQTIKNSINSSCRGGKPAVNCQPTPQERLASSKIVALAKGYLVRRLMRTERVQSTVQTIKDALLCALQLHQDREGIRGADVDLHRRLIQQITAACYALHDAFITSTAAERCAMIAADRSRRSSLANRQTPQPRRHSDIMSQSFSGALPSRPKRHSAATSLMTQSNYESYSSDKARPRYMPSPRRRPWR